MAKRRVPLHQNPRSFVEVDTEATNGATLGKNLFGTDGRLLRPEEVLGTGSAQPVGNARMVWRLILEIPQNIQKLAALAGRGIVARRADGEFSLRTLQEGTGVAITSPDGDAGDPTIGLADLPDSGTGDALVKITRDGKGRVSGTEAATTDDLAEGSDSLYFTDGRADARIEAQKGEPNGIAPLDEDSLVPLEYLPPFPDAPVTSVNGQTGDVMLDAEDVGALTDAPSDGSTYGRKDGAWTAVTGGSGGTPTFPFILQAGASYITLTGSDELPFFLADGSPSNIPVTP